MERIELLAIIQIHLPRLVKREALHLIHRFIINIVQLYLILPFLEFLDIVDRLIEAEN